MPKADKRRDVTGRGRATWHAAIAMLVTTTWLWAGVKDSFLPLFTGWALLVLGGVFLQAPVRRVVRDPFLWIGGAFLLFLLVQWWNAGRTQYFDIGMGDWTYTPPPHPAWPWAFTRGEAAHMLHWFVPAWALGLAARNLAIAREDAARTARVLVYNAGLLALFGAVQFTSGTDRIFWLYPLRCHFFSTFAYGNHAAAFFLLMAALSAGLLYREFFGSCGGTGSPRSARLGICLLLGLAGVCFSLSRTGVILAAAMGGFIALYGAGRAWRKLTPACRLQAAVSGIVGLAVLLLTILGIARVRIAHEFRVSRPPLHQLASAVPGVNLDLGARPELAAIAARIWADHPVFGVGGWGTRYLLQAYADPADRKLIESPGWANVHCDPLQFMAEFGLLGGGLLAAAAAIVVVPLTRRTLHRGSVFTMAATGLALVFAFSLIDLPFRCPAILWSWLLIAATLPFLAGFRSPRPTDRPDRRPLTCEQQEGPRPRRQHQ